MGKYDLLREKVEADGGKIDHHTFDAGEAVTIKYPNMSVKLFSAYWGDKVTAVDQAIQWVGGVDPAPSHPWSAACDLEPRCREHWVDEDSNR